MKAAGHRPAWALGLLAAAAAAGCMPASLRLSRAIDAIHAPTAARFQVEYAPVDEDVAPAVRDAVDHALHRVSRWGGLVSPVVVRVYPDHEAFIAAIGAHDYPWLRAWARYDEVLLQSPRTWGIDYTTQLPELLTHELTHVVMYQRVANAGNWEDLEIPLWFREGMASFTARQGYRRGRPDEIGGFLRMHPHVDPFRPTSAVLREDKDLVYNSGHWSFADLVRSGGEGRIADLMDEMRQGRTFGEAFRVQYGRSEADFLGQWRRRITGSAGDSEAAPGEPPSPPGEPPAAPAPAPAIAPDAAPPGGAGDLPPPPAPADPMAGWGGPGCVAPPPIPDSVGGPTDGQLVNGRMFPNVPGVTVLKRHAFATAETIAWFLAAVAGVREEFPGTASLAVGHASRLGGGRLRPHRSHQSGRDLDASYYVRRAETPPRWQITTASNLDVPRTWSLFRRLLAGGRVEYIFADYGIQRLLHRHAKEAGTSEDDLARIFQFPRGRTWRAGMIRHEPGHRDHFHVRFHCPVGDQGCTGD